MKIPTPDDSEPKMPTSESYGDSDDEALLAAATQASVSQVRDDFEGSPRAAKRRRVEETTQPDSNEVDYFDDDEMLDDGELKSHEQVLEDNDHAAAKRKHLYHAPRVDVNMEHVILTQTQAVPASQPWIIRGPIWKRPKLPEQDQITISNFIINGTVQRSVKVLPPLGRNRPEVRPETITIDLVNEVEKAMYVMIQRPFFVYTINISHQLTMRKWYTIRPNARSRGTAFRCFLIVRTFSPI